MTRNDGKVLVQIFSEFVCREPERNTSKQEFWTTLAVELDDKVRSNCCKRCFRGSKFHNFSGENPGLPKNVFTSCKEAPHSLLATPNEQKPAHHCSKVELWHSDVLVRHYLDWHINSQFIAKNKPLLECHVQLLDFFQCYKSCISLVHTYGFIVMLYQRV